MDDLKSKAGELTDSLSEYAKTYYKYTLLNAADKTTKIAASAMATFAILGLGIFVLFFLGLALGVWMGQVLDNQVLGYLIVAGVYLLIILLLVVLRKSLIFPLIRNNFISKIYEPND